MTVVVTALMLTIITAPPAVPVMVVLAAAAITLPIPTIEALSVVAWTNPACAGIWRTSPVSGVPPVVASNWIPVSIHPHEFRGWTWRENPNHPRWRRRSNCNSNRHLTEHG
jgi:hypothetical protein